MLPGVSKSILTNRTPQKDVERFGKGVPTFKIRISSPNLHSEFPDLRKKKKREEAPELLSFSDRLKTKSQFKVEGLVINC